MPEDGGSVCSRPMFPPRCIRAWPLLGLAIELAGRVPRPPYCTCGWVRSDRARARFLPWRARVQARIQHARWHADVLGCRFLCTQRRRLGQRSVRGAPRCTQVSNAARAEPPPPTAAARPAPARPAHSLPYRGRRRAPFCRHHALGGWQPTQTLGAGWGARANRLLFCCAPGAWCGACPCTPPRSLSCAPVCARAAPTGCGCATSSTQQSTLCCAATTLQRLRACTTPCRRSSRWASWRS